MPDPSIRRPRKDAAANRAGILAAAATTLARDPHASIDAVARAAGLTRRALYGHFADREALVAEVIAAGARRFNDAAITATDESAPLALARLTAQLWQRAAAVQVAAALALDEAHLERTAETLAPLRRTVLALAQRGRDEGTLRADLPASTLARLIEETARTVVTRIDASASDAASLAVRAVLSIAGLSWRESDALLSAHPDLLGAC